MDPWHDRIIDRWNKGQRNGRQRPRDLGTKGFIGNDATGLRYLNRLRTAQQGVLPHRSRARSGPPLLAAPKQVLTPRTAACTVLRRQEWRGTEEKALLASCTKRHPFLRWPLAWQRSLQFWCADASRSNLILGCNGHRIARCRLLERRFLRHDHLLPTDHQVWCCRQTGAGQAR